ncbi:MAG: alpha/beta fold hydrolase [Candidatus Lokiarchaeota archaeon]|nr:alpha/beta fold hydrolase [Candidatus Lokiarchaeota archaeon]
MKQTTYDDYWFHYIFSEDPQEIKNSIKETYINSENIDIHIDIYGKELHTDKNIIFVHGTSVYSRFYAEFLYRLYKKEYRVFAPDLIGHGLSGGSRGHFTMKIFTRIIYDLTSYIRERFGNKIVVMGSSLGGITAFYCAANDPRLNGAVCHNAAIFDEKAYKRIIDIKGILKVLLPTVPLLARVLPKLHLSVFLYLDFKELAKDEDVLESIEYLLDDEFFTEKYSLIALTTQLKAPLARPVEDIETPIMIINGDNDYLFSVDYMREIYDRLTCKPKKLEIIENGSHLIFQEHIDEALDSIISWLEILFS